MISKQHIETICNSHLAGTDKFVTELKIGADNQIRVAIDGDSGVTIDDCVALSRAIEGSLNREAEDFSLDVSSHGATAPLTLPRQYRKHVGRDLEVRLNDNSRIEGTIVSASDEGVLLGWSERQNKAVGKGKVTVEVQKEIHYNTIKEARIKLRF